MSKFQVTVNLTYAASIPAVNFENAVSAITPTGTISAGAVAKGVGGGVSGNPTLKDKTATSITVNPVTNTGSSGQTVEYAISTNSGTFQASGWQDSTIFSGLTSDTVYYIYARTKENSNYCAGTAKESAAIKTQATTVKDKEPAKKGTIFTVGNYTYKITNEKVNGNGTVSLTGIAKNKNVTNVTVAKTVTYNEVSYKITEVSERAFCKNKKITKATIGNNVTKIGKSAFSGCSKLKVVTVGNKVTTISNLAFYRCSKLKTITIGTGLKKLGSHVFCHDKALRTLTIKSTKLTSVGKHTLGKCKDLKIKVPAKKVSAYKKLFKNRGQKKNVKVTK